MHKFTRWQLFEIRHDLSICPHKHRKPTPTRNTRHGNHSSESAYDNTPSNELTFGSIDCFYCHPAHDSFIDPFCTDYSFPWWISQPSRNTCGGKNNVRPFAILRLIISIFRTQCITVHKLTLGRPINALRYVIINKFATATQALQTSYWFFALLLIFISDIYIHIYLHRQTNPGENTHLRACRHE